MRDFGGRKRKRSSPLSDRESMASDDSESEPLMNKDRLRNAVTAGRKEPDTPSKKFDTKVKDEEQGEDIVPIEGLHSSSGGIPMTASAPPVAKTGKRRKGAQKGSSKADRAPPELVFEQSAPHEDTEDGRDEEEDDSTEAVSAEERKSGS